MDIETGSRVMFLNESGRHLEGVIVYDGPPGTPEECLKHEEGWLDELELFQFRRAGDSRIRFPEAFGGLIVKSNSGLLLAWALLQDRYYAPNRDEIELVHE